MGGSNGTIQHPVLEQSGPAWDSLVTDSGSSVLIATNDGNVCFCNAAAARLLGAERSEIEGSQLSACFSETIGRERAMFAARVASSGRPLAVDGLVRGNWTRCTHRPCRVSAGPAVLLVFSSAIAEARANDQIEVVRAKEQDAGSLASLTAREIEILRLIGDGLSTAEIAAELHRSVKTVEWHRVSLGNKLGQANRVGLARLAIMAGLSRGREKPTVAS